MSEWLLYLFMICACTTAATLLFIKNVFHAALALLVTLLCVAALFVLLAAEFLAVTQVLIYAGGMIVVLIFGIMLTTRLSGKPLVAPSKNTWPALLAASGFFFLFARLILEENFGAPRAGVDADGIRQLSILLFTHYSFAFELAGLLLVVSLVAASVSAFLKPSAHA